MTRRDGGPAFPHTFQTMAAPIGGDPAKLQPAEQVTVVCHGLSVRDYFATKMPTDEIAEITFKHLSRVAMEYLAGRPYPAELKSGATLEETAQHQVDRVKFYCAVSAAIRYLHAEAMLVERAR